MLPLPETFALFLVFIGGNIFVGFVVSKFIEPQKFFQYDSAGNKRSGQWKNNFVALVHIALGIASYFLVQGVSPEFIERVQPLYAIIAAILPQYFASTEYHDAVIAKREEPVASTTLNLSVKSESGDVGNTNPSGGGGSRTSYGDSQSVSYGTRQPHKPEGQG